jgi:hypothetical protein
MSFVDLRPSGDEKGFAAMKNKMFLLVSLLLCNSLVAISCSMRGGRGLGGGVPGSGNIQTETRDAGAFTAICIEYPSAEIIIQQGDKENVEIEADDNLLPQLSTEVLSGRLTITSKQTDWNVSVNPSQPVKMTITARDLNEIVLSAPVGDLEVNGLQTKTLKLVLSGGAQIKLNELQVDLLDSELSGAGDIQASGTANEIKLILSGLGNFDAADLKSDKATIELTGMGNATVRVERELAATVSGAGSVQYFGNPRVEQKVNGAGSVKRAEQAD